MNFQLALEGGRVEESRLSKQAQQAQEARVAGKSLRYREIKCWKDTDPGTGQAYCPGLMPNFFIRESSVVRLTPMRAAAPSAPPTWPLLSVSARTICSRCL